MPAIEKKISELELVIGLMDSGCIEHVLNPVNIKTFVFSTVSTEMSMYRLEALDVDVKQEIDTYNQERYQSIQIEQDLYKLTETAMSLSRLRFAASLDSNRVLKQDQLESLN